VRWIRTLAMALIALGLGVGATTPAKAFTISFSSSDFTSQVNEFSDVTFFAISIGQG
jgi:hypothetical protein